MTNYSQLDPRWKDVKLGFSELTIGGFGCTVTCLTNWLNRVFNYDLKPDVVNEKLKDAGAFIGALIYWKRIPVAFPELSFKYRYYNYDNVRPSFYVYIKKIPVLVEVYRRPTASRPDTKHWVLYIGNRRLIDPIDGKEYPTSKYDATGYALFDKA